MQEGMNPRAAIQVIWQQYKLSGNKGALGLCQWNQGQLSALFVQKVKMLGNFLGEKAGTPRVPACRGCYLPAASLGSVLLELEYPVFCIFSFCQIPFPVFR